MARGNQDESPKEKLSELSNIREQYESLFKEVSTLNKEISRREKMARLAAAKAEAEARKAAEEKAKEAEEKAKKELIEKKSEIIAPLLASRIMDLIVQNHGHQIALMKNRLFQGEQLKVLAKEALEFGDVMGSKLKIRELESVMKENHAASGKLDFSVKIDARENKDIEDLLPEDRVGDTRPYGFNIEAPDLKMDLLTVYAFIDRYTLCLECDYYVIERGGKCPTCNLLRPYEKGRDSGWRSENLEWKARGCPQESILTRQRRSTRVNLLQLSKDVSSILYGHGITLRWEMGRIKSYSGGIRAWEGWMSFSIHWWVV